MTMRAVVRPIAAMASTMGRLAAGDLGVEIPAARRKDEIGQMARAVLVFKEAAIAKLRLEDEAETARRSAESERAAREAEKAEEARQDQFAIESLGQGLERLADGDLAQDIDTPFAAKTERLRADFNASVAQAEADDARGRHERGGDPVGHARDIERPRTICRAARSSRRRASRRPPPRSTRSPPR